MQPTLVEKAPHFRSGGYVIDFWGAGFDVAERMNLLPAIREQGYRVREVRLVGADGVRVGGFSTEVFTRLSNDRFVSLPRGDLATLLYGRLGSRVETLFGDSVVALDQDQRTVRVSFEHSAPRHFDLVIGADGLHSQVRKLTFGSEASFEKYLGYQVAAFEVKGYRPRDPGVYVMYGQLGQQTARFSMRNDRSLFLFVFAHPDPLTTATDVDGQKALLRRRFRHGGWECDQILETMDVAEHFYFDRVSQIRMEGWTRGRVALVGDSAFSVSLLAGQGSALAMTAAYVLAGELKVASGDYARAFARYQDRLRDLIGRKQRAAERFGAFFVPASKFSLFVRNRVSKLLTIPLIADLAIGPEFEDHLELPAYCSDAPVTVR